MAEKSKKRKLKIPRSKEEYPALNVKRQVSNRREFLDMDYLNKLSPKEKDWLNRALEETIIGNFKHDGEMLDNSEKAIKAANDANNARNRCIYTRAKVTGQVDDIPTQEYFNKILSVKSVEAYSNIENTIIKAVDYRKKHSIKPKKRNKL